MAGRPRSFDRDEALSSALKVFWTRGYADASMAHLTAAMGINSPSLYAAFGSKENLFREAIRLYTVTEGAALWSCMHNAPSAREAIEGLLLATARVNAMDDRPKGCLVALSGVHPEALPEGACEEVETIRNDSLAAMTARLERARVEKEIGANADPAAMAAFYTTVQKGMTFRAREGATSAELTATARTAMLAWDGLTRGQA